MASGSGAQRTPEQQRQVLLRAWRWVSRAATAFVLVGVPVVVLALDRHNSVSLPVALAIAIAAAVAVRGLLDLVAFKLIPRPSLLGASEAELRDDAMQRRRRWYWRSKYFRLLPWMVVLGGIGYLCLLGLSSMQGYSSVGAMWAGWKAALRADPTLALVLILNTAMMPLFVVGSFFILFGPLLFFNLQQMKGYEPGDADWGVRLSDVRGQKEPKEEVTRVITLWQSSEEFKKRGGKPERGLLFIGAPGTGKTMLSKAIATSFNAPIVTMPGSGFAATFVGIDVIVVRALLRKARKLARKWGGTCIVFIDEIDAVGLRRAALGQGQGFTTAAGAEPQEPFFGRFGALNPSGDLILENRAWREHMFASRAENPAPYVPAFYRGLGERINRYIFPGAFGGNGGMALNQLLVQMDGVDEPRGVRKFFTNRINTLLDASYLVPRTLFGRSLRIPPPPPRTEQIYFIGATNVPIEALDPALIRPGRMGRHIWFRTPTANDRKDIFDLYLEKVAHDPDLDGERRRDELARITNGYSPAMIEQVCSMALTYAHSDGRPVFEWGDIVEAMTTIESGTAQGIEYVPEETRAVAIHEAGHAVASHVYQPHVLSTRLSIRKRGGSLGHHQAIEQDERFVPWRHELVGRLVWTLGALAAERVFYGENSQGVAGDLWSATRGAGTMVGIAGMGPEPIDLNGRAFLSEEDRKEASERIMQRFERIGEQLMNRASGQVEQGDQLAAILRDQSKSRDAARILGQAYVTAECVIRHNRDQVLEVATALMEHKELHGDEVVDLLNGVDLEAPVIDLNDESIWPML